MRCMKSHVKEFVLVHHKLFLLLLSDHEYISYILYIYIIII